MAGVVALIGAPIIWLRLLSICFVAPGEPSEHAVVLEWTAPPSCPDGDAVRQEIDARLGEPKLDVSATGTVVEDTTTGAWVLRLSVRTDLGRDDREIRADSCAALTEAAGLLIAIAADPSIAQAPVSPTIAAPDETAHHASLPEPPAPHSAAEPGVPPTADEPAKARTVAPSTADSEAAASSPRRRHRMLVRGLVRADAITQLFHVLPGVVAGGVGGAAGVLLAAARVELRARYMFGRDARYPDRREVGGTIDLWTVAAHAGWAPRIGPVELPVTAGVELGSMRARSFGVVENGRARALHVGLPVDIAVVWTPVPRFGLRLGAEGVVLLRRSRFHVRGLRDVFRAAPAGLRFVAGVEVRFP